MGTGASVPQNSTKTKGKNSSKSGKTKGKTQNSTTTKKPTGTASKNKSQKPATAVHFDPIQTKVSATELDQGVGPLPNGRSTKQSSSKVPPVSALPSERSVKKSNGPKSRTKANRQPTTGRSNEIENQPPKQPVRTQYVRGFSPDDENIPTGTRRTIALPEEVNKYTPLSIAVEQNSTSGSNFKSFQSPTALTRSEPNDFKLKSPLEDRLSNGHTSLNGTPTLNNAREGSVGRKHTPNASNTHGFCPQCLHCQHSGAKKSATFKQPPWIFKQIDEIPSQDILMDNLDEEAMQLTRMTVYSSNRSRYNNFPHLVMDKQQANETPSFSYGSLSVDKRMDLSIRPIYTPYQNL